MANLETLELTIAANSEGATQGIGHLIRSLSALSTAVGKSVAGLMKLNEQLKELKGYGALKLPNIDKAKAAANSVKKGAKVSGSERNIDEGNLVSANAKSPEQWQKEYNENVAKSLEAHKLRREQNANYRKRIADEAKAAAKYAEEQRKAFQQMIQAEKERMNVRGQETRDIMEQSSKLDLLMLKQEALRMETISMAKEGKLTTKQIAERSLQYQKLSDEIQKLKDKMAETQNETGKLAPQATAAAKVMKSSFEGVKKSAGGLLSTIGRIFKTMLIRQAIRTLLKGAKEGLDNYYQYAKQAGLSFGSAMDKISSKWMQLKNQMGATLGQALSAVLPILNAICSAALVAFNALSALFALLTGKSTYSKATEVMNEYSNSINKAGGSAKQWLATFDELNVMTTGGGGGGGGGGNFAGMFEETDLPQWMYEWKGIIEAVLGGVLGALILPKIWDWIKKIFGLFGDSAAKTAMDFMMKFISDGTDFKVPDLGSAATDMVTFGAGAAAAAAALPTVREEVEKIVAALDGVSLLGSLLGLLGELVSKALASIMVPVKLDTKQYDDFKKRHDTWLKKIDKKTVRMIYDDDPAFIVRLNNWLVKIDRKNIKIAYDDNVAFVTKLTNWIAKKETKWINIRYDDDIAFVTKLVNWVATTETKQIYINISYSVESAMTMLSITTWIATETKKIIVNIAYDTDSLVRKTLLDAWTKESPTKYINIILLDQVNGINKVSEWIAKTETKYIDLQFTNAPSASKGSKITGDIWEDFKHAPVWEWFDEYLVKPVTMLLSPEVTPEAKTEVTADLTQALTDLPATAELSDQSKKGLHDDVVDAVTGVAVKAKAEVTTTVKVSPDNNGITAFANKIKKAISGSIVVKTGGSNLTTLTLETKAKGGIVSGDMFIANENGVPEMIGRFGNQTAVANTEQIVEGISRGVSDANEEQNALLREQNSLLMGILQKDSSVRIGASSELGRVVNQSMRMYGAMVRG